MLIYKITSTNLLTSSINTKISPLVITIDQITYLSNLNVQVVYQSIICRFSARNPAPLLSFYFRARSSLLLWLNNPDLYKSYYQPPSLTAEDENVNFGVQEAFPDNPSLGVTFWQPDSSNGAPVHQTLLTLKLTPKMEVVSMIVQ